MTVRQRVLDAVVVVLAMAVVLSVLNDSFTPRGAYLMAGMVPVLVLLGLAVLLNGREAGGWVFSGIAILVYAPLGALVALRAPGAYLLPTTESMARTLGGTATGTIEMIRTLPPVDASGEVLLVPYAIGFLAGGGAAWLALGTQRALAPVVPVLVGLAAAIALGPLVPDGLVVRGAALAGLLVWWVSVRTRRTQRAVGSRRGATSQAVLAALVIAVVSATVVMLVPDDNEVDRALLRNRFAGALDSRDLTDPIGPQGEMSDPRLLLRTAGVPRGEPLRFAALDQYTEAGWVAAGESPGAGATGRFQRLGSKVTPLHDGPEVEVRVRVQPAYVSDWLPTLGELTSLVLDYTGGRTQLAEVRYNQATSTAFVVSGVDPRDDYTFTAVLTSTDLPRGVEPHPISAGQRQPEGEYLDPFLVPWQTGSSDPVPTLRRFMRHLATEGSLRLTGTDVDLTPDSLSRMLKPPRIVGTPHQYAAVVALAASRLGIPGRLVVGATPDRRGRVLTDDVTSWVEVQVEDGTWRRIDPDRYLGGRPLGGADGDEPAGAGTPTTVGPDRPGAGGDLKIPKGADIVLPPGTELPHQRDPRRVVLTVFLGVLIAALALLLLVPPVKAVRRRARSSRSSWSRRYVGGWQEVVDAARDRGTPVPERLGRVPQALLMERGLELARTTESAIFAPDSPSEQEEAAFWEAVRKERRALVADASRQRRVWAWFNPASLMASWRRSRSG
jgi:hypothetical protein